MTFEEEIAKKEREFRMLEDTRKKFEAQVAAAVRLSKNIESMENDLQLIRQDLDDLTRRVHDSLLKSAEVQKLEHETLINLNKILKRWL